MTALYRHGRLQVSHFYDDSNTGFWTWSDKGIKEALAPTQGIAAEQRKGVRPLVPWGCRGIVVLPTTKKAALAGCSFL